MAQIAAHWLVVVLIPVQIWTSGGIGRSHADHMAGLQPNPYDLFLHELHTFTGLTILGLVLLRLLLRVVSGSSRTAEDGGRFLRLLALSNHFALYATLVTLPATGFLARYFDFGTFGPVHVVLTRLLLALVVLHVTAALWHLLWRRDSVVQRMLPG
ncbi:cytochrome b/b6 domain-containing protein [Oceaniradius stylonematis]|uniref:cytochrome b/b6 domain-containing protein n=1 Tax=Oceaniradius stylonematis TaxID=2184161 RepID=UPI00273F3736|nr:cytochrome b/b6 domain-containing protein [Oceaniradius stylonematis]